MFESAAVPLFERLGVLLVATFRSLVVIVNRHRNLNRLIVTVVSVTVAVD